jgi:hypothetical protein
VQADARTEAGTRLRGRRPGDQVHLDPAVGEVADEIGDVAFEAADAVQGVDRTGHHRDAERRRHAPPRQSSS